MTEPVTFKVFDRKTEKYDNEAIREIQKLGFHISYDHRDTETPEQTCHVDAVEGTLVNSVSDSNGLFITLSLP